MPDRRRSAARVVTAATLTMLVAAWPPFLVAVLAPSMSAIGVDVALVAGGVAVFFALAAVLSPLGGRMVGRVGPQCALRLVAGGSAAICGCLAFAGDGTAVLVALGAVGALNCIVQPATNALIRAGVPVRSQGLGFGIVQAAIPFTVVAAGALVPLVRSTGTWRAAFVVAAGVGVVALIAVPRSAGSASRPRDAVRRVATRSWGSPQLAVLALAAACAAASATALAALAASGGAGMGLPADAIAVAIAAMGLACAALRALAGRLAGWRPDSKAPTGLLVMIVLFLIGAGGFALLATGDRDLFSVGVILAYGFGWAWTGVLNLVVSSRSDDVARATGRTQMGVFAGAALGPAVFAFLAGGDPALRFSWTVGVALLLVAVVCVAAVWFRDQRGSVTGADP
ncbi:MFS transporter [Microbacterium sp. 18062]|uniref:MFS transporter n=1 Tax=Microbacterium sp. 18062 TaxID=2681410 RepID=UPI001356A032|nr:MFS transporter [Microbacterium sp. 18062]